MKKLFVISALLIAAATSATAQTLQIAAPDFAHSKLFDSTAGFVISGLGADDDGNVYYLESDARFPAQAETILYKRSRADGYGSATPLFNYGAPLFGAFVVAAGESIYFAESSSGSIRRITRDGAAVTLLGTVAGIYDLAFLGSDAFVSANPQTDFGQPPENKVFRFDISTGQTDAVLDTGGDYSGPLEFDTQGRLLYGGSGVAAIRDLHAFSSGEIAGAIGPSELALAPPSHRLIENGRNVFLAHSVGLGLWKDDFSTLTLHDLDRVESRTVATTPDSLGQLDAVAGSLFVNVTSFGAGRSSVYSVVAVPEPSSALLGMAAVAFFSGSMARRARRQCYGQ